MNLIVTDEQQSAVRRGEPVQFVLGDLGDVVIISKDAYETLIDELEKAGWAMLGQKAVAQWGRDNPYET